MIRLVLCWTVLLSVRVALAGEPGTGPATPPGAVASPDTSPLVHEAILAAPPAEVWKVWSTAEGFKAVGVAKAEVDLRVGGLIRSHYKADGVLGDEGTIQNRIIAYEPERMMAFRIDRPPARFPFHEAWKDVWTVITMTDLGDGRTHIREASLGYTAEAESQALRRFFLTGNAWTLKRLVAHFEARKAGEVPAAAHVEPPLAPVDVAVVVPGACQDVWETLATARGWTACFGSEAKIDLRPGGAYEISLEPPGAAGGRGPERCTILGHDPLRVLSFTWSARPDLLDGPERRTWVVVTLEAVAAKVTRVRLRHLGFEEGSREAPRLADEMRAARARFAGIWPRVLGALVAHHRQKG